MKSGTTNLTTVDSIESIHISRIATECVIETHTREGDGGEERGVESGEGEGGETSPGPSRLAPSLQQRRRKGHKGSEGPPPPRYEEIYKEKPVREDSSTQQTAISNQT